MKLIKSIFFLSMLALAFSACNTDNHTYVIIETEYGNMKAMLYDQTPQHKANFIKLVKEGYYDSLMFHRVIPNFMIQGGDPDSKNANQTAALGMGGPGYTIPAEFVDTLLHKKGALSAARLGDQVNPNKESSGSQFYIVQGSATPQATLDAMSRQTGKQYTAEQAKVYQTVGGTPFLDGQYTVFGQVVEGLEVIDKIAAQPTSQYSKDRPNQDIRMKIRMAN